MPQCAGCDKTFSRRGYANHLAQTTQPDCVALREQDSSPQHPEPISESVKSEDAVTFEGDFFGQYDPFDLNDNDNDSNTSLDMRNDASSDESSSASSDDGDYEDDDAWEAPPGPRPPTPENDFAEGIIDADNILREVHHQAAQQITDRHTFRVDFPGDFAGTPIPDVEQERDGYHQAPSPSPWAPFRSRLDWEFAKWAKTRGPGSTAVTELLKIEGVCLFRYNLMQFEADS